MRPRGVGVVVWGWPVLCEERGNTITVTLPMELLPRPPPGFFEDVHAAAGRALRARGWVWSGRAVAVTFASVQPIGKTRRL